MFSVRQVSLDNVNIQLGFQLRFLTVLLCNLFRYKARGDYQLQSVTVVFGDEVWEDALVTWPEDTARYNEYVKKSWPTEIESVLVFSFFNGKFPDGLIKHLAEDYLMNCLLPLCRRLCESRP